MKRIYVRTIIVNLALLCIACSPAGTPKPSELKTFDDCVNAGYPVLKTFPPRCITPDGTAFIKSVETCEDQCGDGTCQEIVCMAIGCPCAESSATCASDCK